MAVSSLKERFGALGRVQYIPREMIGSAYHVTLRYDERPVDVITACVLLARRGIRMIEAKRAVENLWTEKEAVLFLPVVESAEVLTAELNAAGIVAVMEPAQV